MDGMIWSKQGKRWLDNQKKGGNLDYHVVGVCFDGNTLYASDQFAAARDKAVQKRQGSVQIELKGVWRGVKDFYLPMNRMDFQCGEGYTYRDVFSGYLSYIVSEIRKKIPEKTLVMAVSCPERDAWKRDVDEYTMMLEYAFGTSENKNIYPVLVSLPVACERQLIRCGTMLYIGIEREWTEFVQLEDGKIIRKTAVAFGYKKGQTLTRPLSLRMNDYANNSTAKWSGITFSSWEAGFAEILQTVQGAWGIKKNDAAVVCPDEIEPIIQKHLSSIGNFRIRRISDWAAYIARFVGQQMSGIAVPEKKTTQNSASDEKKTSGKRKLWEL